MQSAQFVAFLALLAGATALQARPEEAISKPKETAKPVVTEVGPAPTKTTTSPWIFRCVAMALIGLLVGGGYFLVNSKAAEPARKRFLPQSVLQKVSEMADTNSSGDDVDKLNRALGV